MKKILFLTTMIFLLAAVALAQNKADFSGRWELDTVNSKMDERMRVESMTMKVDQTERDITVGTFTKRAMPTDGNGGGMTRGSSDMIPQALTYSLVPGTAAKAETVAGGGGQPTSAQTNMLNASLESDGKLKLHSIRNFETQAGKMEIKIDEIWELADGGKTLKVTRTTESPRGTRTSELIFTKKDTADTATGKIVVADSSASSTSTPATISGGVLNSKATNLVKPAYPEAAKAARAGGAVNVQVVIDEQGNIISATAVSGDPLLRVASEDAARASKFSPVLLSGRPVKVTGVIVYNFVP